MASFLKENIRISLRAIRSQLLRTTLTALIISFGIMALVGILTAIDAIKSSINSNFTSMGANTFTIRNREMTVRIGRNGKRPKRFRSITYDEAIKFTKEYSFPYIAGWSSSKDMEELEQSLQIIKETTDHLITAIERIRRPVPSSVLCGMSKEKSDK